MEQLPTEIVLHLLRFLDAIEIVNLQLVCRRLHTISRDNNFWKAQCFETSSWEVFRWRRELLRRRREVANSQTAGFETTGHIMHSSSEGNNLYIAAKAREKTRMLANWDPSYSGEKIDWYSDYIHRHAPISVSWLQQPMSLNRSDHEPVDVRGSGVFNQPGDDSSSVSVAPLDDGSVCLWDLSGSSGQKGRIIGRSPSKILSPSPYSQAHFPRTITTEITECVSADSIRKKVYIAVQSDLIEIDLETLQVVSRETFPCAISALSQATGTTPITIGTNLSLHIHDPRAKRFHSTNSEEPNRILHPPLSIVDVPSRGGPSGDEGEIYVAGRFPSILNYDRRWFPRLRRTLYSGARLCSLALIPSYPLACPHDRERIRRGDLSLEQMNTIKAQSGHTLIAGGEYNSKGSLEFYRLDSQPRLRQSIPLLTTSDDDLHALKNRQTSSSSKLLSVSNHGALIVFSDGRGSLKWFERDGVTGVREWNVSQGRREATLGIFGVLGDSYLESRSGDIVRKISHAHTREIPHAANEDDLVLWTGEKIGLLSFSCKPGFTAEDFEESAKTAEEIHREREERVYGETMRRALERQADEVRFVRGLGLGLRGA